MAFGDSSEEIKSYISKKEIAEIEKAMSKQDKRNLEVYKKSRTT